MIKIGFFDSGHGGLGVLEESMKIISGVSFYYIGDNAYHPYGDKTDREILKRCRSLTKQLVKEGCKYIVVACNSATAAAIDELREEFSALVFIGIEPYLNILSKKEFDENVKIGTLVTKRTFESSRLKALKERVDHSNRLEIEFVNELASFVEDIIINKKEFNKKQLASILAPVLKKNWNYVILGCTHYPLILNEIESLLGAKCLDPAPFVARQLKDLLDKSESQLAFAGNMTSYEKEPFSYLQTNVNKWEERCLEDFLWWHY